MVELVGVEEVTRPRRREHQQHLPVPEQPENLDGLRRHVGVFNVGAAAAVVPDHLARVEDRQCQGGTGRHEDHERNIRAVVHRLRLAPVVVHDERNQAADDAAHVEDAPEEGYVRTLLPRRRVRHHDRPLPSPEQPGADPEIGAGDDGEDLVVEMVVVEERAGVEDVGGAAGEEGEAGAEDVVDSAAENPEDGEGGVQGGVGVVGGGGVDLPAAAHAGEGVEHSRTAETYQSDQADLNQRRVVSENRFSGRPRRRRGFFVFSETHF